MDRYKDIESLSDNLSLVIEEQKRSLENKMKRLEMEKAEFERVQAELKKRYDIPENVIELNVSGKKMACLKSTLTKANGSMLQAMFSGLHPITKVIKTLYLKKKNQFSRIKKEELSLIATPNTLRIF